jgi:hypothetical protein
MNEQELLDVSPETNDYSIKSGRRERQRRPSIFAFSFAG